MRYVVLGTAGHIDHGKSTLVKALTGTDPDRLKEEKERGITIDLGFANLDYPEAGLTVGIVDVPGHERLIRNMLAGAGGIDIVLLVVAADEGVMPQSREHLQICQLLKISRGLVALTKADLVEEDWLELVTEEVKDFIRGSFLEGSAIIPVSAKSGKNIGLLKEKIWEIAAEVQAKPSGGLFRLPVDRVFTLKGFGTVVTGTALSGMVRAEEPVEILPKGIETRIRGLQSHGKAVREAFAGQRVALNLQGVEKDELERGDVVVSPGRFLPVPAMDVKLELLAGAPVVKTGASVHFHLGTSEKVARVILYGRQELKGGESCYAQLRLSGPVVAQGGDRFVIRRLSPLETIGGGSVLDVSPGRRRKAATLEDLEVYEGGTLEAKLAMKIMKSALKAVGKMELEGWIKAGTAEIEKALSGMEKEKTVVRLDGNYVHSKAFAAFRDAAGDLLRRFHAKNPLKPGMPLEELRAGLKVDQKVFAGLLPLVPELLQEKDSIRLKSFQAALSGKEEEIRQKIVRELERARFQPPEKADLAKGLSMDEKRLTDMLRLMDKEGSVVRINESLYLAASVYGEMLKLLKGFFSSKPGMAVSEFRDTLGTTRKYALPFLEYLDSHKVTMRVGDLRKLLLKD